MGRSLGLSPVWLEPLEILSGGRSWSREGLNRCLWLPCVKWPVGGEMETEDQGEGSTESRGDRMARGPERDHGSGDKWSG